MNMKKLKQELCLSCLQCCKTMIIPTVYNFVADAQLAILSEMRDIKYIDTNMGPFALIPCACKFLTNKGCRIYDRRPDICRNYDGRNVPLMEGICKWYDIKITNCSNCSFKFEYLDGKEVKCPKCGQSVAA